MGEEKGEGEEGEIKTKPLNLTFSHKGRRNRKLIKTLRPLQ
jgi:hypothetical protein